MEMSIAEVMMYVRWHCDVRRHIREYDLPAANRSGDATERAIQLRRLNYHSRVGYQWCLIARAIMKGDE
jgi:hypothetical protein